jgi:hypothetical protein
MSVRDPVNALNGLVLGPTGASAVTGTNIDAAARFGKYK